MFLFLNLLSELMVFLSGGSTGGSITSELCCKVGEVLCRRLAPTYIHSLPLSSPTSFLSILPVGKVVRSRKFVFPVSPGHDQPLPSRSTT